MKSCYPLQNKKCIANVRKVENGIYILNSYSVNNREDYFNYTSSYIFELCNGDNSIEDIIKSIMAEFNVIDEDTIIEDTKSILHEMWCRGYIIWKDSNNPFIKYYEYKVGNYVYCQGNLDLIEEYSKKLSGVTYTDIHYNKDVILSEDFMYSTYLSGINTVFALKNEGKCVFRIFVNLDILGRRVYIRHMQFIETNDDIYKIYRNFLEWACKDLVRRNCINSNSSNICNCIITLDDNKQKNSILYSLGFEFDGVLKKEVFFDEHFYDALLYNNIIQQLNY